MDIVINNSGTVFFGTDDVVRLIFQWALQQMHGSPPT